MIRSFWLLWWSATASLIVFSTAYPGDAGTDAMLEEFRRDVSAVLGKLNPELAKGGEKAVRGQLQVVVDKYAAKLRPQEGSKTYASKDKMFVLVIAANGANGKKGGNANAEDATAKLVFAIAGDGAPAQGGNRATGGGLAMSKAPAGIAIALGGRGGLGGAGGAGALAEGKVGDLGLGGEGGKGINGGGSGGGGSGSGIRNLKALIENAPQLMPK